MVLLGLVAGCTPTGPRALLQGERLIREGDYARAVQRLKLATELLPRTAQAWNHLGLAYHGAGQASNAIVAYRKALTLDRDLIVAHYNLGCVWLEHGYPAAAIDELTSFVGHPVYAKHADGWLRLGTANLRARRWDEAEKTYNHLLKNLEVRTAEVFNNLGVVFVQRSRPADAITCFNSALSLEPAYAPALLNLAGVYRQRSETLPLALQKYREYLDLKPTPPNVESVRALLHELDAESAPVVLRPITTNVATVAQAKPTASSPAPAPVPARSDPDPDAAPPVSPVVRTTVVAAAVAPKPVPPPPKPVPAPPKPAPSPPRTVPSETAKPPAPVAVSTGALEVASIPPPMVVKPPQDLSGTAVGQPTRSSDRAVPDASPPSLERGGVPDSAPPKRNLFRRLNPFRSRSSQDEGPAASQPRLSPTSRILVAEAVTQPASNGPSAAFESSPPPGFPRYQYSSPVKPTPGVRSDAERYFLAGVKAQRAGQTTQAISQYRKAVNRDPAYFDAYYNLALAAAGVRDMRQALAAHEYALALRPDSADARYNFALALKQAGYVVDAAEELTKILAADPNESRAHVSLANLYAHYLRQPSLAREHFQQVLAKEPNHPQAAQIRYWLANHP